MERIGGMIVTEGFSISELGAIRLGRAAVFFAAVCVRDWADMPLHACAAPLPS